MWNGGGTTPVSLVNVKCIPRQYLVLGQLGSSLLAGDQDGKWEGELPNTPVSSGSFQLWDGMSTWPSIWRLAPDVQSSKSLDLVAIDMTVVTVNWNSRSSHTNGVQRPLEEIKTTWFVLAVSFSHWLGLCLYATNGDSLQTWGCLLPWKR